MRQQALTLIAAAALLQPRALLAQSARPAPDELRLMAGALDAAVLKVSRPAAVAVIGGPGTRGYLLPGYGVVFVLPPRALAGRRRLAAPAQGRTGVRGVATWHVEISPSSAEDRALDRDLQSLELEVESYSREAEETRRHAERVFEQMARQIRVRLAPAAPSAAAPAPEASSAVAASAPASPAPAATPEAPPEPPAVPSPPAAPAAEPPAVPSPPAAPAALAPAPPPAPEPPAPPPWRLWLETREPDLKPLAPEQAIAQVRDAVVSVLASRGNELRSLRSGESVAVVVDFAAGGLLPETGAPPLRTLLVRALKKDLDARQEGRLTPEQFRARLDVREY
jgi:hypothetical protein